jgi:alkyl sulfatase BDS1-like metallo-beta-lactamase superfamily hydrolase
VVTDRAERWSVGVVRGALHATAVAGGDRKGPLAEVRVEITHPALGALVFGATPLHELEAAGDAVVTGDREALVAFLAGLDTFTLMFPIITP